MDNTKKVLGIYSMLIISSFFWAVCLLFYFTNSKRFDIESMVPVFLVFGFIFFKIVIIDKQKVRIFRPLWFLYKRNSILIEDIGKVQIYIITATGGSVTFSFFNKDNKKEMRIMTQMYNFEIRNFIKEMKKRDVEVTIMGTGFYNFD